MMAAIDDASKALNAAFTKLGDTVADLMSLDVMTVTGTIKLDIAASGSRLDPTALFNALEAKVQSGDDVRILALSHKDADSDTVVFVQSNLSEAETKLLEAHREIFKAAEQARLDFLKLLISFVPKVNIA
jgi:hypothetical protein